MVEIVSLKILFCCFFDGIQSVLVTELLTNYNNLCTPSSVTWTHPYMTRVTTMHKLNDIVTEDHVLSAGVIFTVCAFLLGES